MRHWNQLLCFTIALGLGVVVESLAARLDLWRYRRSRTRVLNVIVMFGLVQGLLLGGLVGAHRHSAVALPLLLTAGAALGLIYEAANSFRLHAWTWPDRPLLGLRREVDKAAVVGVAWGGVPVFTYLAAKGLISVAGLPG